MQCRYCGSKRSRVRNTYRKEIRWHGKTVIRIRRRRVCSHCGIPFFTVEREEEEEQEDHDR